VPNTQSRDSPHTGQGRRSERLLGDPEQGAVGAACNGGAQNAALGYRLAPAMKVETM
jgi:hypothetical protein